MVETVDIHGVPHAYKLTPPIPAHPTLVFVHGWLLSHGYWLPLIEQLSQTYQCLAYDLRGFGDSRAKGCNRAANERSPQMQGASSLTPATARRSPVSATPDPCYTPLAYALDLIELLKKLEIRRAWLVGHSLGGSISLWAADHCPDLIEGVVCVNSGGGIYLKEEFERFRTAGEQLVKLRPRWLCYLPFLDLLLTRMSVARPLDRRWGRQRLLDLVNADASAALGTLMDSTTEAEVHLLPQVVARLSQPVHFIAGRQDLVMEPQYVRHLASFHPLFRNCGENVLEIDNCGHLAMVEHPNLVAQTIREVVQGYTV